ncbi:formylglycine-generating enzyme family protein [Prevotella sp. P5-92]|uniref:formylglycine-generating enzyme family protein n=1 Tax=Prevotella sp. P5-92 TaxID=2024222 RepID=UPI0020B13132|nr:formylglycine-generating enzyme family protein [Prevotella sp. P5-92]
MKQILSILFMLLFAAFSFAQELKVKSFIHDEMNLEARLDGGRTDLNGKQCALVKVMVRDDIVECKGGNVGDIISRGVVKKIFVSPSARYLELEFKYSFPLKVTFADYGYSRLTEGSTYTITLVDAYLLSLQPVQPQNQPQSSTSIAQNSISQETPSLQSTASAGLIPITVNDVKFNMIRVDGGIFNMGATSEQQYPDPDEKPVQHVPLISYYIGETEVTQALWKAVMGNNPSNFKGDNLPVETVSWDDCQKFVDKLNNMTGKRFRLPTEAEWEFAARGGNKSKGTQYSGSSNIGEVAWYHGNSGMKTHPVKQKKANELGIYDMSGNVWEWCQDWYGSYGSNHQTNTTVSSSGAYRVNRGGSWGYSLRSCRTSERDNNSPDSSGCNLGFRLVLSMD